MCFFFSKWTQMQTFFFCRLTHKRNLINCSQTQGYVCVSFQTVSREALRTVAQQALKIIKLKHWLTRKQLLICLHLFFFCFHCWHIQRVPWMAFNIKHNEFGYRGPRHLLVRYSHWHWVQYDINLGEYESKAACALCPPAKMFPSVSRHLCKGSRRARC